MRGPTVTGPRGEAWDVSHVPRMSAAEEACRSVWILHVPSAHPWWQWYMAAVVSLEDIPGAKPAYREYPDAEWEFALYALHPDKNPDPADYFSWQPLLPVNVQVHFHGCDADRAIQTCDFAVQAVLNGLLPAEPDDYFGSREQWERSVRATASCTEERHP